MSNEEVLELIQYLLEFDKKSALSLFDRAAKSDNFVEFFSQTVSSALEKIGKMWENGTVSLSQVYMSGKICEELVNHFFKEGTLRKNSSLKVAAVTFEDHHNLGKKIVKSVIRSVGYEVDDLGSGKGADEIAEICKEKNYDVLLLSTLMLDAAMNVKGLIEKFRENRISTKVIVGGAPFFLNRELWKKVGADGVGFSASDALAILEKIERGQS